VFSCTAAFSYLCPIAPEAREHQKQCDDMAKHVDTTCKHFGDAACQAATAQHQSRCKNQDNRWRLLDGSNEPQDDLRALASLEGGIGGDLGEGWFWSGLTCSSGDGTSCTTSFAQMSWNGKCASGKCCWFPGAMYIETYDASDHDCSGAVTGHCSAESQAEVQEWVTVGSYGGSTVVAQARIANNAVEARIMMLYHGIPAGTLVPPTVLGEPGQCMSTCGYYCPTMRDNMEDATAQMQLWALFHNECPDCVASLSPS